MKRLEYITPLDGLRGVAALMVMTFHFFGGEAVFEGTFGKGVSKAASFGQTGVDLFFVLSGFLITRILLLTREKEHYFKNFYARRVLRIFPLYYGFLVLMYFVLPPLEGREMTPLGQQWWFWAYLQNVPATFYSFELWEESGPGHFWSLAVEEHFYLVWPLAVYLLRPAQLMKVCVGIFVVAYISRLWLHDAGHPIYYFTPCRMDTLAIGAVLALWEYDGEALRRVRGRFFRMLGIAVLLMIAVRVAYGFTDIFAFKALNAPSVAFLYFAVIGVVLCNGDYWVVRRVLDSRPLRFSGKISYGMYVYHPLCFRYVEKLTGGEINLWLRFALSWGLVYAVSWVSFAFFEKQFLKLKAKFST